MNDWIYDVHGFRPGFQSYCRLLLLVLTLCAAPSVMATELPASIGLNITDPVYGTLSPTDIAGAPGYEQSGWLNISSSGLFPIDTSGTTIGVSLTPFFTATVSQAATVSADERLMASGTFGWVPFSSFGQVRLSAIPYGLYDVVTYVTNASTEEVRPFKVIAGSSSVYGTHPDQLAPGYIDGDPSTPYTYREAISSNPNVPTSSTNYAVFHDLSQPTLDILVRPHPSGPLAGSTTASLSAVQLVKVADGVNWTSPTDGVWADAFRWDRQVAPNDRLNATFSLESHTGYTVSLDSGASVRNLSVDGDNVTIDTSDNSLHATGIVTVDAPNGQPASLAFSGSSIVTADGGISIGANGRFSTAALINADVVNAGVFDATDSLYREVVINGNYVQTAHGTLAVTVDVGAPHGTSHLSVNGTATLNGTLAISVPGMAPQPGARPSYDQTFAILEAASTAGVLNDGNTIIEAKYSEDNTTAGLFRLETVDQNSVSLSQFHQVHVLSYGVNDIDDNTDKLTIVGAQGAARIHGAFSLLPGVVDNVYLGRLPTDTDNLAALTASVTEMAGRVHAGDTFVMYVNTHGTFYDTPDLKAGSENPIIRQFGTPDGNVVLNGYPTTTETHLVLGPNEFMSSQAFASMFDTPEWAQVNKLFVMDTCYAGGFWENQGGPKYLASLPRSAIIGAASEENVSWGDGNGGFLGQRLYDILLSTSGEITYSMLSEQLKAVYESPALGSTGMIQGNPEDGWGHVMALPPHLDMYTAATGDFDLGMIGAAPVPEPSSFALLSMATIAIVCGRAIRARRTGSAFERSQCKARS